MENTLKDALSFGLEGRTAVVTGGGKGLGLNLSRALVQAGARVLISGRDQAALISAAAELSQHGPVPVEWAPVDLGNRASVLEFAKTATARLGRVDIYVGNAAMEHQTFVDNVDPAIMDSVIETNVAANLLLTSAFSPAMKAQGWGRIIYISSNAATIAGHFGHGVYSASKAAIEAYARCAAIELGRFGITANSIAPGNYITGMVQDRFDAMGPEIAKQAHDSIAAMTASGRWGEPREMEGALLLLASEAGRYITGTVLAVDSAFTIKMAPS